MPGSILRARACPSKKRALRRSHGHCSNHPGTTHPPKQYQCASTDFVGVLRFCNTRSELLSLKPYHWSLLLRRRATLDSQEASETFATRSLDLRARSPRYTNKLSMYENRVRSLLDQRTQTGALTGAVDAPLPRSYPLPLPTETVGHQNVRNGACRAPSRRALQHL